MIAPVSTDSGCVGFGNDYITITCQNKVCTDSEEIELHNSYTREVCGNILTTGIPRQCSDGAYTVLCNDKYIPTSYASYLCRAAGYEDGIGILSDPNLHGRSPIGITSYYSLHCPDDYVDFEEDCNITAVQCHTGELDYVVQCTKSTTCSGSDYSLLNNHTAVVNGVTVIRGIPINCSDGYRVALCNEGTVDLQALNILCSYFGCYGR